MWFWLIGIGVLVGSLLPWQPVINSRLGAELASPLWAGFISFLTGAILLGVIVHLQGAVTWRWQKLTHIPYWMLSGGVLGVTFVLASIHLIPRLGAMGLSVSFILGQLLMSVMMDHFGWFGLPTRTIDPLRITGLLLLLAGVWLVVRPAHAA